MARILYGLSGEGSGHSTRAKEIISYLLNTGHEVKVVSYDKGYKNLKDVFDVTEIDGLGFSFKDNQVDYLESFIKNYKKSKNFLDSTIKVGMLIKSFNPDLVFTDFEPICAMMAGVNNIPLISIDNQHFITGTAITYPDKYKRDALLTMLFINSVAPTAKKNLAITFVEEKIIDKNTLLFPPILRKEVLSLKPEKGGYFLVYLTSGFEGSIEHLRKIDRKFIVYGLNRSDQEENILFKVPSAEGFLEDLRTCKGIIANSGFSLISEALYLEKPYLAIPIKNQFEQVLNAYYLEKEGYGKFCEDLSAAEIEDFMKRITSYEKNLSNYSKEDNSGICAKIMELIIHYTK
jgi:uncharacterized protein (TIGR00661 family)